MADFTKPQLNSKYTDFITELKFRDEVVGSLYSSDVTVTGLPADNSTDWGVRSIRWNATNSYFQRRNSSNNGWERLEGNTGTHKFVNLEAGDITATAALSGASVSTSGQVQGGRFNATSSTKPANGFYLPSTNEICFTTGSSERLTIESNGEVGINTVNPAEKLHVVGNARIVNGSSTVNLDIGKSGGGDHASNIEIYSDNSANYGFKIARASGTNGVTQLLHNGTGAFSINAVDAADLKLATQGTTRLCVDSDGSVAIGNFTDPSDHLHVKKGTNDPVYVRVANNEGFAKYGSDGNHAVIDCDVHKLRSANASATYLETSSSLFDIKTAAKAESMSFTNNIQPSFGNTMFRGINWAENAHGLGSGDKAYIRYYAESGENTRLLIGIENDADDDIYLSSSLVHTSSNFSVNGTCTATTFSGSGSSLTNVNATTLDNIDSGSFLRSDANDTCSGVINFSGRKIGLGVTPQPSGTNDFGGRYAAICLGDGDTGIAQNGDGELELWSNNDEMVNINQNSITMFAHVVPNGSRNLGSTSNRWQNLYVNDLKMSNHGKTNDVDGTWGDYTIQEGHEDLYLINHRTGKKFKFALIPVANH